MPRLKFQIRLEPTATPTEDRDNACVLVETDDRGDVTFASVGRGPVSVRLDARTVLDGLGGGELAKRRLAGRAA